MPSSLAPAPEDRRRVAVVGASGYSGEELCGLLRRHPRAEIACVTSRAEAGRRLDEVFPRFRDPRRPEEPRFIAPDADAIAASGAEWAFLALPHGLAAEFAAPLLARGLRVIDLSADFRLRDPAVYEEFYGHPHPAPALLPEAVYGSPELHRDAIRTAKLVAAPGCYPTSILVPLAPLLRGGVLDPDDIAVFSLSGVSGAGRKADVSLLYVECNENARAYGAPKHRHLSEIEQELGSAAGRRVKISFTPHLAPLSRGILTTIAARLAAGRGPEEVAAAWAAAYAREPFVRDLEGGDLTVKLWLGRRTGGADVLPIGSRRKVRS